MSALKYAGNSKAALKINKSRFQERNIMSQMQFEKVVEEVKALSPAEQRRLQTLLETWLAPAPAPMTEEVFAHKLVECGVLSEVPSPITDLTPYQHRHPITTTGTPLSQVILEERR
jgi:hypothetical protein